MRRRHWRPGIPGVVPPLGPRSIVPNRLVHPLDQPTGSILITSPLYVRPTSPTQARRSPSSPTQEPGEVSSLIRRNADRDSWPSSGADCDERFAHMSLFLVRFPADLPPLNQGGSLSSVATTLGSIGSSLRPPSVAGPGRRLRAPFALVIYYDSVHLVSPTNDARDTTNYCRPGPESVVTPRRAPGVAVRRRGRTVTGRA